MSIEEIIKEGDFDHYGIRVHRGNAPVVGNPLENSKVWVDGECTDDELNGVCALHVTSKSIAEVLEKAKMYAWDNEPVILVGAYLVAGGQDDGEIVMHDNECLAIIS